MADWCTKSGLQLIQILPINDSGEDPSPYSAASSFALHPIFVRPSAVSDYYADKLGKDMSGMRGWATSLIEKLNGNWKIDYPQVLNEKAKLMDGIFDAVGREEVLGDDDMMAWVEKNRRWLDPYAGFKVQMAKERSESLCLAGIRHMCGCGCARERLLRSYAHRQSLLVTASVGHRIRGRISQRICSLLQKLSPHLLSSSWLRQMLLMGSISS